MLATVYERAGRFEDRERALRNLVRLGRGGADVLADLGETVARVRGNVVTAEARDFLERARAIEPDHRKARFYLAVAAEQDGEWATAAERWNELAALPDQPRPFVDIVTNRAKQASERADGAAPAGPGPEDIAAAEQLSDEDRRGMIEGMVARLAERLSDEPDDFAGWTRLVRSYIVLGRDEDARTALRSARAQAGDSAERRAELDRLERSLPAKALTGRNEDGS